MPLFAVKTARELLAVVLCPARVFTGGTAEDAEAGKALRPVKAALIRRYRKSMRN